MNSSLNLNKMFIQTCRRKQLNLYTVSRYFGNKNFAHSDVCIPSEAQIVIAGAGIVANSVAYHLVQNKKYDILVFEQDKIGSGTSQFGSGTLGLLKPLFHRNVIQYSIKLYQELQQMGYNIQMKQCGSLNLAQTKDRLIALRRRMAYNLPTGLHCDLLTAKQVNNFHPFLNTDDLEGAVWVPYDAVANPVAICDVLAILAQQGGARYFENTSVCRVLTKNGSVYAVETSRGTVKCEYFINCAGMWSRELGLQCDPQVRIPAYPAQHFYATTGHLGKDSTEDDHKGSKLARSIMIILETIQSFIFKIVHCEVS